MNTFPCDAVTYEGPTSKNPLSFKHYNASEVVAGKTMTDWFRFGCAYWHTMRGNGSDPFGMANAVELSHVTKTFGDFTAVDDLSLIVPAGSVYGFIGPNGSGKTTTLRMISRIYIPDHGTVKVLGEERHGAANDRVFYLPEERAIYPQMRVREALTFFAQIKGYSPTKAEILDWLEKVGLPGVAEKRMNQLSKGMGQKVQFLAAVMAKPELAMLDEPFSALDPMNAVVLRDLIGELRKQGTTVIFSTHDMRVAE